MLKGLPGEVTAFLNTLDSRALEKADTKNGTAPRIKSPEQPLLV
jgi:hypothetical protein